MVVPAITTITKLGTVLVVLILGYDNKEKVATRKNIEYSCTFDLLRGIFFVRLLKKLAMIKSY